MLTLTLLHTMCFCWGRSYISSCPSHLIIPRHYFNYRCHSAKECPLLCIYSLPAYSAVDCGDPGTPTNGERSLSRTIYNSVVTYTCDVGYTLQGSNSRTCQSDGLWSGSVPQCSCELGSKIAIIWQYK